MEETPLKHCADVPPGVSCADGCACEWMPKRPTPAPLEIPLDAARILHDMLGDLLAEHDPAPAPELREQYAAAIELWFCTELCGWDGTDLHWHQKAREGADAVLAVRDTELQQLRDEVGDLRHNLALRAFTAPDADFDTILGSLDARINDAVQRGEQAEAAVARVAALAEEHPAGIDTALVLEALDPEQGQP